MSLNRRYEIYQNAKNPQISKQHEKYQVFEFFKCGLFCKMLFPYKLSKHFGGVNQSLLSKSSN